MEQVLRIFRKDVRHLWPIILMVLALMILHAVFDVLSWPTGHGPARIDSLSFLLKILLPLAIWFLIAQAIFQEAIPGQRQFWVTRPYSWSKLLASKFLFAVAFVSVPLFVSDCCILAVQGLPVLGDFNRLLLRQLIVAVLFILPSFAIASLTTGLAQFLLAWFLLLLGFVSTEMLAAAMSQNSGVYVSGLESPFLVTALAVIACGVVTWQYATRHTIAGRLVLLIITCAFLPLWGGVSLGNHFRSDSDRRESPNGFNIRIAYDPEPRIPPGGQSWQVPGAGYVRLRIPLTVAGLTPETLLSGSARVKIYAGGRTWPDAGGFFVGAVEKNGGYYWQDLILEKKTLDQLKQQRASLHASYNLNISRDQLETKIRVARPWFFFPGVGLCRSFLDPALFQLTCRAGLTPRPEIVVRLEPPGPSGDVEASLPGYSMPWGLSPTTDLPVTAFTVNQTSARLVFFQRRKVAALRYTLDIKNIRLADYVLRP
ncbi:MAG: hypothetical protein WB992_16500 [Bryobacteraceae bacterium]